jgi:hypothetical protein
MVIKKACFMIERIKKKMNSLEFMNSNRTSEKHFSRKRKLPFVSLVCFMLGAVKRSIQKELTDFIRQHTDHKTVSKSAFCQQRTKLKPEAFIELNQVLIDEFYTDNEYKTLDGMRVLAIDGSTLELPRSKETIEEFGVNNQQNMVPMSRISTLYDPLNDLILDSEPASFKTGELSMAVRLLENAKENDLVLFDRGYPARWFFFFMFSKKINYVARVQRNFGNDVEDFFKSNDIERVIEVNELPKDTKNKINEFSMKFQPFKFRVVKVILDSGEIEVLATSLLDKEKYQIPFLKETYWLRWGIEVNYYHLKNHIELANFSGYSIQSIKQDFFANMLISNIQTLLIRDAQMELDIKKDNCKYNYKINKNLSLGFLKDRIVKIFSEGKPNYFEEIKQLFQIEAVPIRKGRKNPRPNKRWKRKHYMNQKRAI